MDPTHNENSGNSTPHSEENTESFHYTSSYSGKKFQLYIGNLTWVGNSFYFILHLNLLFFFLMLFCIFNLDHTCTKVFHFVA